MTILERFKEHLSGYIIGSLGWILVITYILFEYVELGSFLEVIEHLKVEKRIYHITIFLLIPMFMVIGYLFDKKEGMEKQLKKYSMELEQIVEERTRRLRDSEEKYRSIAEKSLVGVYIIQDDVFRYVNDTFTKIFGYTRQEIENKIGPLDLTVPKDREMVKNNIQKRLSGEVESMEYEVKCQRKDGEEITIDVLGRGGSYQGKPAIIGTLIDITEKKKIEKEKEEIIKDLEDSKAAFFHMLKDLDKSHKGLEKAYEELKEIDRVKSDIIANVSHELRTPLTIAKSAFEMVMDEESKEERNKLIRLGREALMRQNRIIQNLIEVATRERVDVELKPENLDLIQIASVSRNEMMHQAKKFGVEIKTSIPKDLPEVKADFDALMRVFDNILDNAVKFNKKGGKVTIKAKRKGDFVEVTIEDTGIGIAKEHQGKIFDRLYQIDATTTRKYGGTGMGLAVAKEIIGAHGGSIWVEGEAEKGSKFVFILPISTVGKVEG